MGHGSSVPRKPPDLKVSSADLQKDCRKLSRDENFRVAFVKFIKSGEWLDELSVLVPKYPTPNKVFSAGYDKVAEEAAATYQMSEDKLTEILCLVSMTSMKSITRSLSRPVTPITSRAPEVKLESYVNIDNCPCFSGDQYIAILFHILYPIYLASPQYRRFLKHGVEHGRAALDDDNGSVRSMLSHSVESAVVDGVVFVPCPQSQRLQDILLGCAAYFDESLVEKRLMEPEWYGDVTEALFNHVLAISVVDICRDADKFIYTNKAFQAMTEFPLDDALSGQLSALNGPGTEASQLLLLREAMKPMQTAKFAITYYTKSKRAFTDLVAVKTTAHYSVMVHFAAVKGANLDDLKAADDLLILVSELLQRSAQTVDATLFAHEGHPQRSQPAPRTV